jgi:hypothetical protein
MFDLGYLSVDTRYRLGVSSRLRTEFGNGEAFYAKEGKVITLPDRRGDQPNVDFLQWHMDTCSKRRKRLVRLDSRDKRFVYPADSACLRLDLLACLASGRSAGSVCLNQRTARVARSVHSECLFVSRVSVGLLRRV